MAIFLNFPPKLRVCGMKDESKSAESSLNTYWQEK